ncbi:MAG: hypothetical protein ACERKZ_14585 [Lachnotalea sp.]
MNATILRYHYRGHLTSDNPENFQRKIEETKSNIAKCIAEGRIMTACIYRYENMLFAYYESIGEEIKPENLFASLSDCLAKWPGQACERDWVFMHHIYYHALPQGQEDWKRKTKPELQRGRIAFLKPDKIFQYVYHHVAITTEGLLHGDKYQSIALHENILFSYFEEPKTEINIKRDLSKDSTVIKEWLDVNPEDHFIRVEKFNFTFIPAIITM